MFNRKKAGDVKYCHRKINSSVKNLQYVDIAALESIFNTKEYREWAYNFSKRAKTDDTLIKAISELPQEKKRLIVKDLVKWDGTLITRFGDEFLNDVDIALTAIGPDHILNMPTTEELIQAKEDIYVTVIDYSKLVNHYDLFPLIGDEVKEKVYELLLAYPGSGKSLSGFQYEQLKYIGEGLSEKNRKDVKLASELCSKYSELYQYFDKEVRENPEVIAAIFSWTKPDEAIEVFKTLSREKQLEVARHYLVGKYVHGVKEELKFLFEDKELALEILKNNSLSHTSMLEAINPEFFKDKEFLKVCIEKLEIDPGYLNLGDVLKVLPKGALNTDAAKLAILNALHYNDRSAYEENQGMRELLDSLSDKAYAKYIKENHNAIVVPVKRDNSKVIAEIIDELGEDKVYDFYKKIPNSQSLPREVKLKAFLKEPKYMYQCVKDMDIDFFVEAIMQDERVLDFIKDEDKKSAVVIAATTIKYLNKKFIKVTSEKELDDLIAKVKKKSRTGKKEKATKTTVKNNKK